MNKHNIATALKYGNMTDTAQNGFKPHEFGKIQYNGSLKRQKKNVIEHYPKSVFWHLFQVSKWALSPILESQREAVHSSQQSITAH